MTENISNLDFTKKAVRKQFIDNNNGRYYGVDAEGGMIRVDVTEGQDMTICTPTRDKWCYKIVYYDKQGYQDSLTYKTLEDLYGKIKQWI